MQRIHITSKLAILVVTSTAVLSIILITAIAFAADSTSNENNDVYYKYANKTLYLRSTYKYGYTLNVQDEGQAPAWFNLSDNKKNTKMTKVVIEEDITPLSTRAWFGTTNQAGYIATSHLTSIEGLDNLDVSNIKDASFMFASVGQITSTFDVSSLKTSFTSLVRSQGMFAASRCVPQSAITTGELVAADCMFQNAINMPAKFDVSNIKFNQTSAVTSSYMFAGDQSTNIVSKKDGTEKPGTFSIPNLQNAQFMFSGCTSTTSLDMDVSLSSLSGEVKCNTSGMFRNCSVLESIFVALDSDWSTKTSESTDMFAGCTNLKGGYITTFTGTHIDNTYAKSDGIQAGYFTTSHPIINLIGNDVTWYDTNGNTITSITGNHGDTIKVKPVTAATREFTQITDNLPSKTMSNTNTYVIDEQGYITIDLLADATITAETKANYTINLISNNATWKNSVNQEITSTNYSDNQSARVFPQPDTDYKIEAITDNHGNTYAQDETGFITVNIQDNATISCACVETDTTYPGVEETQFLGNQGNTDMNLKVDDTQLSFTAPSVINFSMAGSGDFITPSAGVAYIKNNSIMPIKVTRYEIQSDTTAHGVADVSGASEANTYQVSVTPNSGAATPFAVSQSSLGTDWVMQKSGTAGGGDKLSLVFSGGKMINIDSNQWGSGHHLQDVEWIISANY